MFVFTVLGTWPGFVFVGLLLRIKKWSGHGCALEYLESSGTKVFMNGLQDPNYVWEGAAKQKPYHKTSTIWKYIL